MSGIMFSASLPLAPTFRPRRPLSWVTLRRRSEPAAVSATEAAKGAPAALGATSGVLDDGEDLLRRLREAGL